jgi:NodT family efflux transporter outer membrane factor (OMF) lipoprotein
MRRNARKSSAVRLLACLAGAAVLLGGCVVGPKYHTPAAATAPTYKETPPPNTAAAGIWQPAKPSDAVIPGKWWEMFNDPLLNSLELRVNVSNQTLAAAEASFLASRALVREARSQLFPTVSTSPSITKERNSTNVGGLTVPSGSAKTFTDYSLPFDATWEPDLWGRVRNTIKASEYGAQASAADLDDTRLTLQAEVAVDYFDLRSEDALKQLLDSTVAAYRQSLNLTQVLYQTGIDSAESVAQAETQLETTEAQDTNVGILRAQYEHAIAMLVGQPASTFSIDYEPLKAGPPSIPIGVPSQLLERRPDIAASERLVAQANAEIGVARAAYFPNLTLSASGGFQSSGITDWLTWPSRFWSVGPSLAEPIFEGGLRRATVQQYRATYDETVANYRQTVLTAFQQVEDNLAALRILSTEIGQQQVAINSSQRYLALATERFRDGIDPYLNVISAQTTLLGNQQTLVGLQEQQITASVQLIEALGGGWNSNQIPSTHALVAKTP